MTLTINLPLLVLHVKVKRKKENANNVVEISFYLYVHFVRQQTI